MKRLILGLAIGFLAVSIGGGALGGSLSVQWETMLNQPIATAARTRKRAGLRRMHRPMATAPSTSTLLPVLQRVSRPSQGDVLLAEGDGWSVGASLPSDLVAGLGASVNLRSRYRQTLHAARRNMFSSTPRKSINRPRRRRTEGSRKRALWARMPHAPDDTPWFGL